MQPQRRAARLQLDGRRHRHGRARMHDQGSRQHAQVQLPVPARVFHRQGRAVLPVLARDGGGRVRRVPGREQGASWRDAQVAVRGERRPDTQQPAEQPRGLVSAAVPEVGRGTSYRRPI